MKKGYSEKKVFEFIETRIKELETAKVQSRRKLENFFKKP